MSSDDFPLPDPDWSIFDFLDQDVWWKPRDLATAVRIDAMEPSHQRNLLAWLRRWGTGQRLSNAHFGYSMSLLLGLPNDMPESVCDELEREANEIHADPTGWLERTPLVTRLRDLVAMRTVLGGGPGWWEECTCEHGSYYAPELGIVDPGCPQHGRVTLYGRQA